MLQSNVLLFLNQSIFVSANPLDKKQIYLGLLNGVSCDLREDLLHIKDNLKHSVALTEPYHFHLSIETQDIVDKRLLILFGIY
jgi:hypothetical protein